METTRTCLPYFSPNRAMAPAARAASMSMISSVTARSSDSLLLTRSSMPEIWSEARAEPWRKSKRMREGEFSLPAWVALSETISWSALCTMWVEVWARAIARRRAESIWAKAFSPTAIVPSVRVPRWTCSPLTGAWTSSTSTVPPSASRIVPWSASWPPISAQNGVRSRTTSTSAGAVTTLCGTPSTRIPVTVASAEDSV